MFFPSVVGVPGVFGVVGGAVVGSTAIANAERVTAVYGEVFDSVRVLNESPGQICWTCANGV